LFFVDTFLTVVIKLLSCELGADA